MAEEGIKVGCCDNCGDAISNCNCPAGPKGDPGTTGTSIVDVDGVQIGNQFFLRVFYSNGGQEDILLPLVPGENGTSIQGPAGEDGSQILFDTVVDNGVGEDGDVLLQTNTWDVYNKVSGVWVLKGNIKGAQGVAGPQGAQGIAGPSGTNGIDGIDGIDGLGYNAMTSTDSINILDTSAITISITTSINKALIPGSRVRVADSTNPALNFFEGVVTAYNVSTGALDIGAIDTKVGSGTHTNWNISITGQRNVAPIWTALSLYTATGIGSANYTGHYAPSIWVDQILDIAHLSGAVEITNGSGFPIVNPQVLNPLPTQFRPSSVISIPAVILDGSGSPKDVLLKIDSTTGNVTIFGYTFNDSEDIGVFFDGVQYRLS